MTDTELHYANGIALAAKVRQLEAERDGKPKGKDSDPMALDPHEHYDYLVVLCRTASEWNTLCEKLGLVPTMRRGKLGTARAMRANVLLEKL